MMVMTPVPKYGLPKTGDGITNGVPVTVGGVGVVGASLTRSGCRQHTDRAAVKIIAK
ncbi:MAG: hypothetical protein DMF76_18170 [Acidobacteria bacterium]|nr:MAG: hypothetical protein DMF76_18170 [Acidobacteriota bacterium]